MFFFFFLPEFVWLYFLISMKINCWWNWHAVLHQHHCFVLKLSLLSFIFLIYSSNADRGWEILQLVWKIRTQLWTRFTRSLHESFYIFWHDTMNRKNTQCYYILYSNFNNLTFRYKVNIYACKNKSAIYVIFINEYTI